MAASPIAEPVAGAIAVTVVGLLTFALYAFTAVLYGAPLLFVLWLTGAL